MKQAQEWLRAFCPSVYILTQAHYTSKSQLKEDLLKEEDDGSFPRVAPALIGGGGGALCVELKLRWRFCVHLLMANHKIKHNQTQWHKVNDFDLYFVPKYLHISNSRTRLAGLDF